MKLSVALAAAALTVASANIAAAEANKAPAYTPVPGKSKETAQLTRRHYVQCLRRGYRSCAKRFGGQYHRLAYCRRKVESRCRTVLLPGRG